MGTIAQKLQAVVNSKAAIKQALVNKGQSPSDVLSTYAAEIANITTGTPSHAGTLNVTGTYATSRYYTAAGCTMGWNDKNEVFLIMQGGTSSTYENIIFTLASAPAGINLAQTPQYTHASNDVGAHYGCLLTGVTQKININADLSSRNATYDYVEASLTVTYA